jgi:hypothetical protein
VLARRTLSSDAADHDDVAVVAFRPVHAAVPTTLEAVLDAEWLGQVLDDIGDGDRIVGGGGRPSKTLATKVRYRLTLERADGARETRAYCVKAHLDGSPGADILSEARFYGELAPRLDVRSPRAYYTAVDDAAQQAIIIMDDVVANGGQFLGARTPYSLATTRHPGQLRGCMRQLGLRRRRQPRLAHRAWRPWPTCSHRPTQLPSTTDAGPTSPELRSRRTWQRRCGVPAHEVTCVTPTRTRGTPT